MKRYIAAENTIIEIDNTTEFYNKIRKIMMINIKYCDVEHIENTLEEYFRLKIAPTIINNIKQYQLDQSSISKLPYEHSCIAGVNLYKHIYLSN